MSSSKPGAKPSEENEIDEVTTPPVEKKDKPTIGLKENGKQSSESESKKRKREKFPSKPSIGIKANGKESSEPEPKKWKKRQFPSKEEISKARLDVFFMFGFNLCSSH